MKLTKDYKRKLVDLHCKISDLLIFEDVDFAALNAYFATRCSDWTYTKDAEYLYFMLEQVYYNYAGHPTKFSRMQHDLMMQGVFGKISPVLKYVFSEMHPIRDRLRKYHDKLIRELPHNPEMIH